MNATFRIDDYVMIIPMITNFYAPTKEERADAWSWGVKYTSGVFEYFTYSIEEDACEAFEEFMSAVNEYWCDADAGMDEA